MFSHFVNAFVIFLFYLKSSCTPSSTPDPQPCDPATEDILAGDGYCGLITNTASVFGRCIVLVNDLADLFYTNCAFDACQNPESMKETTCKNLAAFAEECRQNGVIVEGWREASGCGKRLLGLLHLRLITSRHVYHFIIGRVFLWEKLVMYDCIGLVSSLLG